MLLLYARFHCATPVMIYFGNHHGSQGLHETAINRPGCVYHTSIIHVDYVDYVRVYVPNWTLWAAGSMPHLRPGG